MSSSLITGAIDKSYNTFGSLLIGTPLLVYYVFIFRLLLVCEVGPTITNADELTRTLPVPPIKPSLSFPFVSACDDSIFERSSGSVDLVLL
jgi:hypothetical protein